MADFNPYLQGNSLVIPDSSSVPLSLLNNVISQYYRALLERQNQPQPPSMAQQIATGVGGSINSFANKMIDSSFTQDNERYKTDQAIRANDASNEALYSRNWREDRYKDQFKQDELSRAGQGLAGVQDEYGRLRAAAQQSNMPGGVVPSIPPSDMPVGPQERNPYEDTPSTGGSVFNSGRPQGQIEVGKTAQIPPTMFDAATSYGRGNPLLLGSYLDKFGSRDSSLITRATDPLAQEKEQTGINKDQAATEASIALGKQRDSTIDLNAAKAEQQRALSGRLNALSQTEEGRQYAAEYLRNNYDKMTPGEIAMWQMAATGKVVKTPDQIGAENYYGNTNKVGGGIDARTSRGLPGDKPTGSSEAKPPQAGSVNAMRAELQRLVDRAGTPTEQPTDKQRIPWLAKQIKDSQSYNIMREFDIGGGGTNITPVPGGGRPKINPRL